MFVLGGPKLIQIQGQHTPKIQSLQVIQNIKKNNYIIYLNKYCCMDGGKKNTCVPRDCSWAMLIIITNQSSS